MIRTSSLLVLALALSTPAAAQTMAEAAVRRGCSVGAPPDSLRAEPVIPIVFVPDERGVVDMEVESIPAFGNWSEETQLPGYRGSSYFRWAGPNLFSSPGVDVLRFPFQVEEADDFVIRVRNQHNSPDPSAENDCWFRLDGGPWTKLVDNWGPGGVNVWSFNAFLETTSAFAEAHLAPGIHTVELSGRSNNFKVDSVHVVPKSVWFASETTPQSGVLRERPVLGSTFTFEIGDPNDAAGLPVGATQVVLCAGLAGPGFPCGTVLPAGELLVALDPEPSVTFPLGWAGPAQPTRFDLPLANLPALAGLSFTTQALFVAPGRLVLTDALDLTLGQF